MPLPKPKISWVTQSPCLDGFPPPGHRHLPVAAPVVVILMVGLRVLVGERDVCLCIRGSTTEKPEKLARYVIVRLVPSARYGMVAQSDAALRRA